MGSVERSAVGGRRAAALPDYESLGSDPGSRVPVLYRAGEQERAGALRTLLADGVASISEILGVEPPELQALLVSDEDWSRAPRENDRPYPPGLPYFTRAARPPALVLPVTLSPVFEPRTEATYPLVVWHELAHAFLLREPVVRTPAWLGEFLAQALSAAVARRAGAPLASHLSRIGRDASGSGIRSYRGRADASDQMSFQNSLLALGDAAVTRFGEDFLGELARALWGEDNVVDEERAERLLAASLGPRGSEWLASRPEF